MAEQSPFSPYSQFWLPDQNTEPKHKHQTQLQKGHKNSLKCFMISESQEKPLPQLPLIQLMQQLAKHQLSPFSFLPHVSWNSPLPFPYQALVSEHYIALPEVPS